MTIFDQFRHENSNISTFLPLKLVNFDTKVTMDHFSSFSRIFSFGDKNGPLTHCVKQGILFVRLQQIPMQHLWKIQPGQKLKKLLEPIERKRISLDYFSIPGSSISFLKSLLEKLPKLPMWQLNVTLELFFGIFSL